MRRIISVYIFTFLLSGCLEEYDLNIQNAEPKLVVEGLITNQPGPYYIRLTKSHPGTFLEPNYYSFTDSAQPVMNAQIIISDNVNQTDTVSPIDINIDEYTCCDPLHGYYKYVYDNSGNITDTLFLQDPIEYRHDRGFYKTNKLKGIPGRTYHLKIMSEGKEYKASAFMPTVPEIDSIGFRKKILEKDGSHYYVPLLYFTEPQDVENYYLIQLIDEISSRIASASLWRFSVLSDKFLQPYVNGLELNSGVSPRGIEIPIYMEGSSVFVALNSLSWDAYQFYKFLLQQFENDGGTYKPVPASPPTNISNGGLGLFRASAVVEKRIMIK